MKLIRLFAPIRWRSGSPGSALADGIDEMVLAYALSRPMGKLRFLELRFLEIRSLEIVCWWDLVEQLPDIRVPHTQWGLYALQPRS